VRCQQITFPLLQGFVARIIFRQLRQFDLHADELGPGVVALLLQHVGVNQPRYVIRGVVEDRL
jgi:hypothetical protein